MQPYIFPYIGYFQLIKAVDYFVFYDDVNFIKNGWINRNRIIINKNINYLTIPLVGASSNKNINDISILNFSKTKEKILKTIEQNYKKAPFFSDSFRLIQDIFSRDHSDISSLAAESVIQISKYLNLKTEFYLSSKHFGDTKNLDRADRLIEITKRLNSNTYINPIGGAELYNKDMFKENGINLLFIQPKEVKYKQFNDEFTPWLSIIDVLMFNDTSKVKSFLNDFELI